MQTAHCCRRNPTALGSIGVFRLLQAPPVKVLLSRLASCPYREVADMQTLFLSKARHIMTQLLADSLLEVTQRHSRLKPLREISHPVLDRICLERNDTERLRQFCRALVIFEQLETVLRDDQLVDRQTKIELLLSDLDAMRSKLPALSGSAVCSKCSKIDEAR